MAGCKASCATKDEQQFAFDYNFIPATERDAKQRPKGGPSSRVISRSTNAIISGTHNSSDDRQFFFFSFRAGIFQSLPHLHRMKHLFRFLIKSADGID